MQLQISGPKTLVFQPQALAVVLDALSNLPFRVSQPVIQEIFNQVSKQEKGKDGPEDKPKD